MKRITIRKEWDETHTILLDGFPVFERKSLGECNERVRHLETYLAVEELRQKQESEVTIAVDDIRPL